MRRGIILIGAALLLGGCTEGRVKRYRDLLDAKVGVSQKAEIDKDLGTPVSCRQDGNLKLCEYRTDKGRNEQLPYVHQKKEGFPDLSPYDHYDVLHLYYNDFNILTDWKPIVLPSPH